MLRPVPLAGLRRRHQVRRALDVEHVELFAGVMDRYPPIVVSADGSLVDGSALSEEEMVELWGASGGDGPSPVVDLEQWVVVSMTIPDDACPPELTSFESDWMVLTPVFTEPPGGCRLPLIPKTFVVALDRAMPVPSFVLRLPGDEVYGYDEQQLRIELRSS